MPTLYVAIFLIRVAVRAVMAACRMKYMVNRWKPRLQIQRSMPELGKDRATIDQSPPRSMSSSSNSDPYAIPTSRHGTKDRSRKIKKTSKTSTATGSSIKSLNVRETISDVALVTTNDPDPVVKPTVSSSGASELSTYLDRFENIENELGRTLGRTAISHKT